MKTIKFIFCCALVFVVCLQTMGQYVTLQGRQFKNPDGSDFYPMSVDYLVDMVNVNAPNCGSNTNDYYFAPNISYINWGAYFKCANEVNCFDYFDHDFKHIHDLGFNTVIVAGLNPWSESPSRWLNHSTNQQLANQLYVSGYNDPITNSISTGQLWDAKIGECPINCQDPNDPIIKCIFRTLEHILDACIANHLKLMIGTQMGDGVRSTGSPMDLQYLQYIDLLTAEVTSLSTARQSALLCYQMAGEPGDKLQTGMPNKSEFCSLTKEWYLRLKQGDPNHLVATGGYGPYSVWDGDPGVAMMDFYLIHFYPGYIPELDGTSRTLQTDRMKSIIYWMANNSPVPWVVGETGFADNIEAGQYSNGNITDAINYLEEIINCVRNCGGSGISIWNYQNDGYGDFSNNMGILSKGNTYWDSDIAARKKSGATNLYTFLHDYLNPTTTHQPPAPDPSQCVQPSNVNNTNIYYNPFNHPTNTNSANWVIGNIKDQNNNNIKDAVVTGESWIGIDQVTFLNHYYGYTTFTDANGNFTLIPYDWDHSIDPPNIFIDSYKITELGGDRATRGFHISYTYNSNTYNTNPNGLGVCGGSPCPNNFILSRNQNFQNNTNGNIPAIITSSGNVYSGGNNLDVSGVIVNSSAGSEFKARENVHVTSEFHASNGSETHIFIGETFPDCPDFSGLKSLNAPPGNNSNNNNSELELKFLLPKNQFEFTIYPNPGNGIFNVEIMDNISTPPTYQIKITDLIGRTVYTNFKSNSAFQLDLASLAKGIYYIQINTKTQKLIIQ